MEKELAIKIITALNGFISATYFYFGVTTLMDFLGNVSRIETLGVPVSIAFKNIQLIQIFELFGIGTIFVIFAILSHKYADKILD
ncbi:MAG: hypothetical protein J7K00_01520 [Candidatus Diapherotrites archaeon]|nr:hypothetical protein [Candidatus Diapherotrites archaeon]